MTAPLALGAGRDTRPRNAITLAALLLAAGIGLGVATLVAAWASVKGIIHPWPPKGVPKLDNYPASMLIGTSVLASISVERAVWAVRRNERRQAITAFATSLGFGLAFLNVIWYIGLKFGTGPGASAYAVGFFAFLVTTGVLAALACIAIAATLGRVVASQLDQTQPDMARATAIAWHVAASAWAVAWVFVYFPGLIFK